MEGGVVDLLTQESNRCLFLLLKLEVIQSDDKWWGT